MAGGMVKKALGSAFRKATVEEVASNGLSGKLVPYRLKPAATVALTAGAVAATTGPELVRAGQSNKVGYTSFAENLDRLISYDGSGFAGAVNRAAKGNTEVMRDIVQHTFTNPNNFGADGNIVFALHNLREG
jgi:hypothetical protein